MSLSVAAARTAALFASPLQPSDTPDLPTVASAIASTVRAFGTRGCAARVAQEYGDHPDEAASRMRWAVRTLIPLTGRNGHAQDPRPLGEVDLRELPAGQAPDVPRHALRLLRPALTASPEAPEIPAARP